MKRIMTLLLFISLSTPSGAAENTSPAPVKKHPPVAVVKSRYDSIEKVLDTYRIPHEMISYRDLEDPSVYGNHEAVFFPCGIEEPLHEKLSLLSRGRSISSVSLKDSSDEPDIKLIGDNIRMFIQQGGVAYFSGYTFKQLQQAFSPFSYFSNFPYMGKPGRIIAKINGDLEAFCIENELALYMTHPGWIAVKSAEEAEIIATASYDTPQGEKSGPISMLLPRGDGEILYTSYHSTMYSNFRRFNIYRVAGHKLIRALTDKAKKWEQIVTARISDAVHNGESVRMYRIPLHKGENTLYFTTEGRGFQVDVLDRHMGLIESRDSTGTSLEIEIEWPVDEHCFVKLYPSAGERFKTFALVIASGDRFLPHYTKIAIICGVALAVLAFFLVSFIIDRGKYAGRRKRF